MTPTVLTPGPVRLLHLSDLHAREGTAWDADPVTGRVGDAVRRLVDTGLAPDLVVFTGDAAWSGRAPEFDLARSFFEGVLQAAQLGPDRLFVVPGNHDLDRGATRTVTAQSLETALRAGDDRVVGEVLGDPDQARLLHVRYTAWLAFLAQLGVAHPRAPWWAHAVDVRGTRVHLAGLDSALLHTGEDVAGRLVMGLRTVNEALHDARAAHLVVALAHHPLSWLTPREQGVVLPPLRAQAHALLRGHLHETDPVATQTPHHRLFEAAAGSLYDGSRWPNAFHLLELDPAAGRARFFPQVWSPGAWGWMPDRNLAPPDGVHVFPL